MGGGGLTPPGRCSTIPGGGVGRGFRCTPPPGSDVRLLKPRSPSFGGLRNGHGNHLSPGAPRYSREDSIRSPQRARTHPPNFKGAVTRALSDASRRREDGAIQASPM